MPSESADVTNFTFSVDLTAEGSPFHADWDSVQAVLDRLLHHYGITHSTLLSDEASSVECPRFPPGGFLREERSYKPLIHFLNAIVHATNDCLPSSSRYLRDLSFHYHGREMKEIFDSNRPLKPDVLGLLRCPPPQRPQKQKISWSDVAIIVEAKNRIPDLILQLSTYARCYIASDRRRSFVPAIGFNHWSFNIYIFAIHRSGLSVGGPIPLKTPEGFRSLVSYMVGILSIPDEEAFSLDMTRVENVFRINDRDYDIVRPISVRNQLRGHAAAVYSLKLRVHPTGGQEDRVNLRSRTLMLADGVTTLPDRIVYKLSYKAEGQGQFFSAFLGQFGIMDVVGFHISGPEERFGSTEYLLRNWTFCNFTGGAEGVPAKKRYLHCTAMSLECLPLFDFSDKEAGIPTPAELVETILHAMIGHYNLFLGGVLHRDVNLGSILRLREPIERSGGRFADMLGPVLGPNVNLSKCRGFLVDSGYSIEWRKAPLIPSTERLGVPAYRSVRLLCALADDKPIVYTAVDDLESFLLVLVTAVVNILKKFTTTRHSTFEYLIKNFSNSTYTHFHLTTRLSVLVPDWKDVVFVELLLDWVKISLDASRAISKLLDTTFGPGNDVDSQQASFDQLEEFCRTVYMKYIRTGFNNLESIRRYPDWNAVVEANPGWFKLK